MKRVLIFHPAIAPYRLRFFNDFYERYNASICLYYNNLADNRFGKDIIEDKLLFQPNYIKSKIRILGRTIFTKHKRFIVSANPDLVITTEFGEALWVAIIHRIINRKNYKIITMCDDSVQMGRKQSEWSPLYPHT